MGMNVAALRQAIGHRIRTARLNAEMTQAALAKALDVCRPTVINIEKGSQGTTVERLIQIARILQTPTEDLLPPPPPEQQLTLFPSLDAAPTNKSS